jgi:acyl-CoA reductase-like NAD-dependent aldehyde dehydrogenase
MHHLPVIRWGQPYESLQVKEIVHFQTGDPLVKVSQANGGLVLRDLKRAANARKALRQMETDALLSACERAAHLFVEGDLDLGNGTKQPPGDYIRAQSATTGLPEHMCRANMQKIHFVLSRIREILDALTRGLDLDILARGYGKESRGVTISYTCLSPVLGAVLPSNSPGVHTLWLPAIPLRVGLVLKPGSLEPWTPYRIVAALVAAGVPAEALAIYPGEHDVGTAVVSGCRRVMVFGSQQTVQQYAAHPGVQVHGPGSSKILLGDDIVDHWQEYLDVMQESILSNGGRSCINCSAIFASRHTWEIASALSERLGPIEVKPPTDDTAQLAAFPVPSQAEGTWAMIANDLHEAGVTDMTSRYGPRLVSYPCCAYLRPTIVHCDSPGRRIAAKEFLFPFATVVKCAQADMLSSIGPTLVATAITQDQTWLEELTESPEIDRLNTGPIPTSRLNWLQPHEGNIVEFLYRSRAYQSA